MASDADFDALLEGVTTPVRKRSSSAGSRARRSPSLRRARKSNGGRAGCRQFAQSLLVVVSHERRSVVYFNVTSSPSAEWTAQQVVQAFPFDAVPRFLIRDRDSIYGAFLRKSIGDLGIEEVLTAYRSPS